MIKILSIKTAVSVLLLMALAPLSMNSILVFHNASFWDLFLSFIKLTVSVRVVYLKFFCWLMLLLTQTCYCNYRNGLFRASKF